MDSREKRQPKFLKGLYLHCKDIDYFVITCPNEHVMYQKFRPEIIDNHPRRSLHCEECSYYYNVERVTLKPVRDAKPVSNMYARAAQLAEEMAFWSPPIRYQLPNLVPMVPRNPNTPHYSVSEESSEDEE